MQVLQLRRWSGHWVECSGVGVMEVHIVLRLTFNLKKKKEEHKDNERTHEADKKYERRKSAKTSFYFWGRGFVSVTIPPLPPPHQPKFGSIYRSLFVRLHVTEQDDAQMHTA